MAPVLMVFCSQRHPLQWGWPRQEVFVYPIRPEGKYRIRKSEFDRLDHTTDYEPGTVGHLDNPVCGRNW